MNKIMYQGAYNSFLIERMVNAVSRDSSKYYKTDLLYSNLFKETNCESLRWKFSHTDSNKNNNYIVSIKHE